MLESQLLLDAAESPSRRVRSEASRSLNLIAVRADSDQYLIARGKPPIAFAAWARQSLDRPQAREWLRDRSQRLRLGIFATAALCAAGDTDAIPVLEETVWQERRIGMRVETAKALVRLGRSDYFCTLVDVLGDLRHETQDTMPSFLIAAARRYPAEAARCLERGLANPLALGREMSAWIGGAAPVAGLAPALRRSLDDHDEKVRRAASWALERIAAVGRTS